MIDKKYIFRREIEDFFIGRASTSFSNTRHFKRIRISPMCVFFDEKAFQFRTMDIASRDRLDMGPRESTWLFGRFRLLWGAVCARFLDPTLFGTWFDVLFGTTFVLR